LIPAPDTLKPGMDFPVVAGNIPASRTGLGGLLRIDVDYGHPGKGGLICDERSQFPEVPARYHVVKLLGAFDSFPDAQQVFQRNDRAFGLRYFDNTLGEAVIDVAHPPTLVAGFLLHAGKPACSLKCGPSFSPALFPPPYLATIKEHVVGQHGQFDNTEVNPDNATRLNKVCFIDQRNRNIPCVVFILPYLHGPLAAGTPC